ncbi:MAG: ABC transporter permease [Bacteroidetes bacterium]|nr:ABC transporter permease [Bacteroidota bacterium]
MMRLKNTIWFILVILLAGWAWEYAAAHNQKLMLLLSAPSHIKTYFFDNTGMLGTAFRITFIESITGLIIATVSCFLIMIICCFIPALMRFVVSFMVASQVIPLITLAPLFIILFGGGIMAKIMMSALLCFFPIFINMANGIKLIDRNIHELLYVYNATTAQKIRYVYFSLSLPQLMAGLKIAATLATIGAIVAEFNGADAGLGKNLFLAAKRLEPELMMNSLFLAGALGALMYGIVILIENRVGKWYLYPKSNADEK